MAAQTSPLDSLFLVAHQQSLFCKKIALMSLTPFFPCATSPQQELAFHSSDASFLSLSAVSEMLPLHHTKYAMAFLVRAQVDLWPMGSGLVDVTESSGSLLHGWRWRTGGVGWYCTLYLAEPSGDFEIAVS